MNVQGIPSSSELIRNMSQITAHYEVLATEGHFRIIQFGPPYIGGYEYWVVNDKGFLWEPAETVDAAINYLSTDDAKSYQP